MGVRQAGGLVQNYPPAGGKWQISNAGGVEPQWSPDGKELFYIQGDTTLMAVSIRAGSSQFDAAIPKPLFETAFPASYRRNRYVVSRDGQKFLAIVRTDQHTASPTMWVLNWAAALKR